MGSEVTVSIPARPDFLHVLRTVIASVAARMDLPYDAIEDLRLATDEACAQLLGVATRATSLTLHIKPSDDSVEILATVDTECTAWPPADPEDTWSWQILSTLADDVRYEREGDLPALRMAKHVSGRMR
jgi:serine/threonine-protein kinase RsbW